MKEGETGKMANYKQQILDAIVDNPDIDVRTRDTFDKDIAVMVKLMPMLAQLRQRVTWNRRNNSHQLRQLAEEHYFPYVMGEEGVKITPGQIAICMIATGFRCRDAGLNGYIFNLALDSLRETMVELHKYLPVAMRAVAYPYTTQGNRADLCRFGYPQGDHVEMFRSVSGTMMVR